MLSMREGSERREGSGRRERSERREKEGGLEHRFEERKERK